MKTIWKKHWKEFTNWFCDQWKYAWGLLRESIITLTIALFEWLHTILGAVFGGLWKLFILPVGKYIKEKLIEWIEKI